MKCPTRTRRNRLPPFPFVSFRLYPKSTRTLSTSPRPLSSRRMQGFVVLWSLNCFLLEPDRREEELHIPMAHERKVGLGKPSVPARQASLSAALRLCPLREGSDPAAKPGPSAGADRQGLSGGIGQGGADRRPERAVPLPP